LQKNKEDLSLPSLSHLHHSLHPDLLHSHHHRPHLLHHHQDFLSHLPRTASAPLS